MERDRPKILFLCTGNSCRSQIAEGLARHLARERAEVHSAGVYPVGVHALAVEVLREAGIDPSGQYSKDVLELDGISFDIVITLCDHARSVCPAFPGALRVEHWPTEDPSLRPGPREEMLVNFRRTRDELSERIREFLERELGPARAP